MDILTVLDVSNVITVILFCTVFWVVYQSRKTPDRFPPGREGLPLVGAIFSVGSHFERTLAKWRADYGPISYVKMGSTRMVVLNTYDAIHEGFVKKGHQLSGRWTPEILKEASNCMEGLALIDYTDRWKEQRKFALSTLAFFGMGKRSIEPRILMESDALCEVLQEKVMDFNEKGFHPGSYFAVAAMNVINTLSYGKLIYLIVAFYHLKNSTVRILYINKVLEIYNILE